MAEKWHLYLSQLRYYSDKCLGVCVHILTSAYSSLVNLLILCIQVFPPFKLIPRKMTLLIGAMMQVCLKLKLHFQTAGLCLYCQMNVCGLANEASAKTPARWCLLNCSWFELQLHFSLALIPSLKSFYYLPKKPVNCWKTNFLWCIKVDWHIILISLISEQLYLWTNYYQVFFWLSRMQCKTDTVPVFLLSILFLFPFLPHLFITAVIHRLHLRAVLSLSPIYCSRFPMRKLLLSVAWATLPVLVLATPL